MSIWDEQNVLDHVLASLNSVPLVNDAHHFGRPWLSAYQLAIKVNELAPQVATALGVTVGSRGTGSQTSLAQYLARELSRKIKADGSYPVEGAFLSNERVRAITYVGPDGDDLTSSLTGSGFDLSLFRRR